LLCYQRAIEIDPSFVEALSNLGAVFREASRVDEALVCFQKALTIQPDSAELHSNLALVLYDLKKFKLSMAQCQLALTLNSNYAEAHNNLGLCFKAMGQLNEAAGSYRRAITCDANLASAHSNLGNVLREIGQYNNAITSYQQAIKLQPNFAEAYSNLGGVLQCLGQFDLAIENCQRALEINPNYAEALNNLGLCLKAVGQTDAAIASYRRAIVCNPSFASAYSNLGNALNDTGQLEEALNSYRKAVEINPNFAEAHNNLGCALKDIAQFDNALVSYRKALEINPNFSEAYSNLLFCLNHSEFVSAQDLFAEHLLFAKQFETPLKANWLKHNNSQEPNRCLRVGFVSADLRSHAVAYFFEAVLVHLAKSSQLSLHAYYNHTVEDAVTQQLKKYLPNWHSIAGLSDDELAKKIRLDGIDILYDLSGHTAKHRLLTFARKPAPIQISWMGYPSTTGLTAMDYYQSERLLFPDDRFDSQFTEKIIRLPASSAFLPSKEAPPVNALPALSNGYITFGSFNRLSKISHSVVKLWAQLLSALPDSRMLLGAMPQDGKHQTLVEWFAQEGIPQTRLIFHMRSNMADYLNLHHKVDICLDTFPYSGGTTTFHALWMGVPTLTLGGQTMAGWVGVSILGHVGLESFAAFDSDDFVEKGMAWAKNLEELSDVRRGLRERFAKSARGQPALIAWAMERALRIIWQRWCEGLPAKAIEVSVQEVSSQ
jgi:predicted O-linked N-acetylglucosamine transferase (SPINDLY family)